MLAKNIFTAELIEYCIAKGVREPLAIQELRNKSNQLDNGRMLITPIQGAFLNLLIKISGTKKILEIGTFTGYSAAWMGLALPASGELTTLDIDHSHLEMARECWDSIGVSSHINPIKGEALNLLNDFQQKQLHFDLMFIDANKSQYIDYYEAALKILNLNGLIIIDNVLMYGQILQQNTRKKYLKVLQELNDIIATDKRVEICLLPIGDGLTIARKIIE